LRIHVLEELCSESKLCALFCSIDSQSLQDAYEAVVSHARDLNALLSEDPKARSIVVMYSFGPFFPFFFFSLQDAYEAVVSHARDLNALLWEDPKARKLVADEACHESLRNFIRKLALPKKKP